MPADYTGLVVVVGLGASAIAVLGALRLGLRGGEPPPARDEASPAADARRRAAIPFARTALVFLVLAVAGVWFAPWTLWVRELGGAGAIAVLLFLAPLLVALGVAIARGALES